MNHLQLPARLLLAIAVSIVMAMATLLPGARSSDAVDPIEPQVQVTPDSGMPGETVTVSGTGFLPGSVQIRFAQGLIDELVASATVTSDGTFTTPATIPGDAVPGPAQFVAQNDVTASADFFVEDSEEIGDHPPADKVPVCEVVVILERVRNRIGSVAGSDRLKIQSHAGPNASNKNDIHIVDDTFVRDEWTDVRAIVGRWQRPKKAFPFTLAIVPFVQFVTGNAPSPSGTSILIKDIDCEDSELFRFVEVRDEDGNLVRDDSVLIRSGVSDDLIFGRVDLEYRVIVRELRAQ